MSRMLKSSPLIHQLYVDHLVALEACLGERYHEQRGLSFDGCEQCLGVASALDIQFRRGL